MIKVGVMVCSYYLLPDLSLPERASDISLEDAIRLTRESGISAIELQDWGSGIFGYDFPELPPKKVLRDIKEVADSYRVRIPTISVMAGNLLSPDGDAQVNYIRRWLALAADIGIKVVKINVGAKPDDLSNDAAFERTRACLLKLVRYAEERRYTSRARTLATVLPHKRPGRDADASAEHRLALLQVHLGQFHAADGLGRDGLPADGTIHGQRPSLDSAPQGRPPRPRQG